MDDWFAVLIWFSGKKHGETEIKDGVGIGDAEWCGTPCKCPCLVIAGYTPFPTALKILLRYFLFYISMQLAMCHRIGNMPKACPYVWVKSLLLLIDGWKCFLHWANDGLDYENWKICSKSNIYWIFVYHYQRVFVYWRNCNKCHLIRVLFYEFRISIWWLDLFKSSKE